MHKPEILASSNQHPTSQGVNKDAKKKFAFWCAKAKSPDCIEASLGKSQTKKRNDAQSQKLVCKKVGNWHVKTYYLGTQVSVEAFSEKTGKQNWDTQYYWIFS